MQNRTQKSSEAKVKIKSTKKHGGLSEISPGVPLGLNKALDVPYY